jgi:hypothetical protein
MLFEMNRDERRSDGVHRYRRRDREHAQSTQGGSRVPSAACRQGLASDLG